MILATTTVEDFDRFAEIYSTKGADKRRQHGSKGSTVYRDPNQDDRVWVIFDWDAEGWQSFASDPDVPGIMQEAGHTGRPQVLGARRPVRRLARPLLRRRRRPATRGDRHVAWRFQREVRPPSLGRGSGVRTCPLLMELGGLEPPTSWVRSRRSPN